MTRTPPTPLAPVAPATTRAPRPALPSVALVTVAVVWGTTFTVADGVAEVLPAPDLVAWRFGLAALVLGAVRRGRAPLPALLRVRGVVLGVLLGSGFLLQAWALRYTSALLSGFLTGLLVVVAPVAAWLVFRDRPGRATGVGVALAAAGVAVLGFHAGGVGPGELLTLASAVVWGLHLVLLSRWSRPAHAWSLARIQTGTVATLAAAALGVRGAWTTTSPLPLVPADGATWCGLLFLALVATAGSMVLLSWGQARVSAARAAVILTLEPAVSGLTATLTGSALTGRVVIGAVLLVGAMAVVELVGRVGAGAPTRASGGSGPRPRGEVLPEDAVDDRGRTSAPGVLVLQQVVQPRDHLGVSGGHGDTDGRAGRALLGRQRLLDELRPGPGRPGSRVDVDGDADGLLRARAGGRAEVLIGHVLPPWGWRVERSRHGGRRRHPARTTRMAP
jgi:drug/metabolite transporter (DMT)-like permease